MELLEKVLSDSGCEPRKYQKTIIEKSFQMFNGMFLDRQGNVEPPARSVMVESPTGSGKTVMGHMIAKMIEEHHNNNIHIGWVANRRNLLSQAAAENASLGIGVNNIDYISMFDKHPTGLINAKNSGKEIMMVVDEAQHDAAASMAHLHNMLEPKMILGLTATPFRTDRVKLCFDKVVKDAGIHQLIQDGFLSRYEHYCVPDWTPQTVANFYCREPEKWGKSVVFFHKQEECTEFARIIQEKSGMIRDRLKLLRPDMPLRGNLFHIVRGGGGKKEMDRREEILDDFRNGDSAILINMMVLAEGFDDKTLETAFVRDSGKGPTIQMAGRVFRPHPKWSIEGNELYKFKKVVQSTNTRWPILKTANADLQNLWQDNEWRSLTLNPLINSINNVSRVAIARAEVNFPESLTKRMKKKAKAIRF